MVFGLAVAQSKASLEKMTQIAFETFNVPALLLVPTPLLALASEGQVTGIVVEFGALCAWHCKCCQAEAAQAKPSPLSHRSSRDAPWRLLLVRTSVCACDAQRGCFSSQLCWSTVEAT